MHSSDSRKSSKALQVLDEPDMAVTARIGPNFTVARIILMSALSNAKRQACRRIRGTIEGRALWGFLRQAMALRTLLETR
jgi:hypothetical protein